MSYEAEDYINFIEQGRKDKLSPSGLDLIAKQFRVMQEQLKTCNKTAVSKCDGVEREGAVCETCRNGFWLRKNTKCLDCGRVCLE